MPFVTDPELNSRLTELGEVKWNRSLLEHTRCPFLRAAAAAGKLDINDDHNVKGKPVLTPTVDSVSKAGGGLNSVLAFFARFNHTAGLHAQTRLAGLSESKFNLDQTLINNQSDGTHEGGVEIIRSPTGDFNLPVMNEVKTIAGSPVLTPETMAKVIIAANHGAFSAVSGNVAGTPVDLAKSAGEWALMFCLLKDANGDVPIEDLEALCHDARVPERGWANLEGSSTHEWVQYTSVITAHIVAKAGASAAIGHMHSMWCVANSGPGCGCAQCQPPGSGFWQNVRNSVQTAIASVRGKVPGFAF